MPAVEGARYERIILHSDHIFAITSGKINSLLHSKRLNTKAYALSDGKTDFGLITITSKPVKSRFNKDTHTVEWWKSTRTLYEHKFEFNPIADHDSVLSNYKIDSTIFPATVYIIPQTMSGV